MGRLPNGVNYNSCFSRWLSELEARMARAAQRNLVSKTKTNKQKKPLFNANKLYGLHFLVSKYRLKEDMLTLGSNKFSSL